MFALFIVLYFARLALLTGVTVLLDPTLAAEESSAGMGGMYFVIMLLNLPLSFFLAYTAFFGEEYGWRGFLQPLLQKRFGLRGGIVVLGVAWGLWHLPINIFFYSPDTWGLSVLNQVVLCICYSVFFGFAYMKTRSIWAPVLIHFFNNNAITLFTDPQRHPESGAGLDQRAVGHGGAGGAVSALLRVQSVPQRAGGGAAFPDGGTAHRSRTA